MGVTALVPLSISMTIQPLDHDKHFRKMGARSVRRSLVNGELKGVTEARARDWLAGRPDWVGRWMLIITFAVGVATVIATIVGGAS